MTTVEGKIARILDEYTVVINIGRTQGVYEGMPFVIFSVSDDEVKDPDSGESLGRLETVKGYVAATHVQEKISICTVQSLSKPGAEGETKVQTLSGAMMAESLGYRTGTEERLNVNPSQISGLARGGPISVGDRVRFIGGTGGGPGGLR